MLTAEQIMNKLLGIAGHTLDQCFGKVLAMHEASETVIVSKTGVVKTIAEGLASAQNVIVMGSVDAYVEDDVDLSADPTQTIAGIGKNCVFDFNITLASSNQVRDFVITAGHTITIGTDVYTAAADTLVQEMMVVSPISGVIWAGPNCRYRTLQAAISAATSGQNVRLMPNSMPYTADSGNTITVPDGITVIGDGANCKLAANVILQGSGYIKGVEIESGYYIQQNGVKYYAS